MPPGFEAYCQLEPIRQQRLHHQAELILGCVGRRLRFD